MRHVFCILLYACALGAHAAPACGGGAVFADTDADGVRDPGERGLPGVRISDGRTIVSTDAQGRFRLPSGADARTIFAIKPAGFRFAVRPDGLPAFWHNRPAEHSPRLKHGGMRGGSDCRDIALQPDARAGTLEVLVFADPQPKSLVDVGYYRDDIVAPIAGSRRAHLGITLGDVVDDDLSLYPAIKQVTATLGVPWLHVAGNHDADIDARSDEESLLSFHQAFGPDTFAWEEREATFVVLDDVIHRPGPRPAYIGGLREEQFAFLEAYLPTVAIERLLVVALHIPLFEPEGRDTFRDADRARLFALLRVFPRLLVLSAHGHEQRHVFHGEADGWQGARPLHEYNVGAASGAYWSGVKDVQGIPDATMADGTPNGYATLQVAPGGGYALAWHAARGRGGDAMRLHAPGLLRRGAYPAWGVYANVFMGRDDSRVEYRIDGGAWRPMRKVLQPDPWLLAENARDDQADTLRGYDRSPEAEASHHLWRGALPTDLAAGEHAVEVRTFDPWRGELRARTRYRLQEARP